MFLIFENKRSIHIEVIEPQVLSSHFSNFGKEINATIFSNDKFINNKIIKMGNLDSIIEIFNKYERQIEKEIEKIIIIGKFEIKKGDEKRFCSLSSLGINNNFKCYIEFGEKDNLNNK